MSASFKGYLRISLSVFKSHTSTEGGVTCLPSPKISAKPVSIAHSRSQASTSIRKMETMVFTPAFWLAFGSMFDSQLGYGIRAGDGLVLFSGTYVRAAATPDFHLKKVEFMIFWSEERFEELNWHVFQSSNSLFRKKGLFYWFTTQIIQKINWIGDFTFRIRHFQIAFMPRCYL